MGHEPGPLVSVVMPAYNAAPFLRESLDSILGQDYRPIEVIVVDDASTDATPAILASYGKAIRSIRLPTNRGQFEAVNAGIALAAGELIAVYHADDVYLPGIIAQSAAFLGAHPDIAVVFCLDVFVDAANIEYGRLSLPPEFRSTTVVSYPDLLNGVLRHTNRILMTPGAMTRAAVYREVGGYTAEPFAIAADFEMWMRIARRHPIGLIHEYLFRYRHFHGNSSQKYAHLRVTPNKFFTVMDFYLDKGDRALATHGALDAYEAHREEDRLFIAMSFYIRGDLAAARDALAEIRIRRIMRSGAVQRGRLIVILLALRLLSRIPRVAPVADVLMRRWFVKRPPGVAQ